MRNSQDRAPRDLGMTVLVSVVKQMMAQAASRRLLLPHRDTVLRLLPMRPNGHPCGSASGKGQHRSSFNLSPMVHVLAFGH